MTKGELRQIYSQRRQALSEPEYILLCHKVSELFFASIDLSFVEVLHVFIPIEKKHEPNTWLIIDRIHREFPHVRLSIPRVDAVTGHLEHFYFEGLQQLKPNVWGILEPTKGVPTAPSEIDMVLVPMLIFDVYGDRVGYGKGFYDRFLKQCRANVKTVGLSLFDPVEQIDDASEHDVRLSHCITPSQAYRFRK